MNANIGIYLLDKVIRSSYMYIVQCLISANPCLVLVKS